MKMLVFVQDISEEARQMVKRYNMMSSRMASKIQENTLHQIAL
jgi:hypothetical protein